MTKTEYTRYVIKELSKKFLSELDEKFLDYCKFYLTKKDTLPLELEQHLYNIFIKHIDY